MIWIVFLLHSMLTYINQFLAPIERIIGRYRNSLGGILIILSFLSLGYLFNAQSVRSSGEQAMNLLWFILWLPIFSRVFGIKLFQSIIPLRKELGILMGTLAFVHGARYIISSPDQIGTSGFWLQNWFLSYLAFWFFALILTLPLLLTSSLWMMKSMGKYWKYLHRTVYLVIILTVVHVVLLKYFMHFEIWPVILLILYFSFKVLEWKWFSFAKMEVQKEYPKGQKWLCTPCGFIYDPEVWDEDSGIKPGTEFTDIPENWSCPLCGVKKSDFIPCEEDTTSLSETNAIVVEKTFLNPTTIEFIIETDELYSSLSWQFMLFLWQDTEWSFTRSYSIVRHEGKRYTFTIKLSEKWRWAKLLSEIDVGTKICVKWVFGKFVLQKTASPKIFIATGTWLAPIYNMIQSLVSSSRSRVLGSGDPENKNILFWYPELPPPSQWQEQKISLYFSVSTEAELFYVEELREMKDINLHIHVTRETVAGFETWRVDIDDIEGVFDIEWYLCGNPSMITEAREKLKARGYTKVYSEAF